MNLNLRQSVSDSESAKDAKVSKPGGGPPRGPRGFPGGGLPEGMLFRLFRKCQNSIKNFGQCLFFGDGILPQKVNSHAPFGFVYQKFICLRN